MWTVLCTLQGGDWVCPPSVNELFLGWFSLHSRKEENFFWRMAALCLLCSLLKERNKIVLEDEQFSLDRLKSSFLRSLSSWASVITVVDYTLVRFLFLYIVMVSCGLVCFWNQPFFVWSLGLPSYTSCILFGLLSWPFFLSMKFPCLTRKKTSRPRM